MTNLSRKLATFAGVLFAQSAANKAVEVARSVGGVKSVKNDMRLK